uniref:Uncharacterized protein n=1 Tax=Cucumis melo TaxID=3656 RepID=A0A9I9CWY0_CUCME
MVNIRIVTERRIGLELKLKLKRKRTSKSERNHGGGPQQESAATVLRGRSSGNDRCLSTKILKRSATEKRVV